MARVDGTPPMDVAELQPCAACGRGMMHGGDVSFYEVTLRQCIVDTSNIGRMHGLEMMMGGAVGIARVLSPDNTIAHRIGEPVRRLLCQDCGLAPLVPAILAEENTDG